MSIIDKVIAAVTPPESEEARAKARQMARAAVAPGDRLSQIIEHHLLLGDAFAAAGDAGSRLTATRKLGVLLTGHAIAGESVIYPALAEGAEKTHSGMGYDEQALVKVQMALLEKLEPMSQDFIDKLEHIDGAVTHHTYQEEATWLLELKGNVPAAARLTQRYAGEYDRYVGADAFA